eukprot:s2642_g15.t1
MALIDSEAAFEARCEKLSTGLKDLFKAQAIKTFSALSFAIGTPQSVVSDTDMKAFSDKVYGREATLGEVAIVKRLHFESNTIVMMDLKSQATVGDSSEPSRKIPFVEKQRRLSAQETRITGITHRNEQQPSHALIDACFTMVESGALIYLPPSKCGSRDSEVHADNKSKQKQILTLEQGTLKSVHQDNLTQVDVGTELKLMFAFQRRGLAFDLVNLLSWDVHTAWTNKLYRALMAEPPAGFASVSLSQLLRADQELFSLLASEFQKPLKAASVDDKPPLDAEITKLMADPRINVFLTPLPKHERKYTSEIPVKNKFDKDGRQNASTSSPKRPAAQVPQELVGLHFKTKDGKPLCWHKNLKKGCNHQDVGLRATAVEKDKNRTENFSIFPCDLTNAEDFKQLQQYVEAESESLVHAHFAPSCGTCSRAREIPVPGLSDKQQPRPLRSDFHPDGLPGLTERELDRVNSANESYKAMTVLLLLLISLGVSVSIENPRNSIFWLCSMIVALFDKYPGHSSYFDHCMHGGTRDKSTRWWSYNPRDPQANLFTSLNLQCDGSHSHSSWKPFRDGKRLRFPTTDEAKYPVLLCQRVAYLLKAEAEARNFFFPLTLDEQIPTDPGIGKRQLFTVQPRSRKLRPVVAEFQGYATYVSATSSNNGLGKFLDLQPKGSRICHRRIHEGLCRDDEMFNKLNCVFDENWEDNTPCEILHIGMPKTPEQFMEDAVDKGHPRSLIARVPETAKTAIHELLHEPIHVRFKKRAAFFAKWLKRSLELKENEAKLHASLPAHLQRVLEGKKLLLWKEILLDLQYPDAEGKPDYSLEHLLKLAPALNASVTGSLASAAESEHDQFVWDETHMEVRQGWLTPTVHSSPECIAKRFPLPQANKVRLIDDFSINGVNGAYGLREKLRVQSVDELCSYIAYMMDNTKESIFPSLVGRTFDLKHAYRQFGVDEYHHDLLKIAVKKPGSTYELFNVGALPFGAVGSVSAFLRISSCLSFIGTGGLSIIWTAFFDDFTAVGDEHETENLTFCVEALFRMLGVWFADSGDKAPPFTKTFKSLGLLFSFEALKKGSFSLEHTEKRRAELDTFLSELLQKSTCNTKDLERLHGRLIWFNSFCFGRRMNSLIRILSNFSHMSAKTISLCDKLKGTLLELKSHVDSAAPVEIRRDINTTWVVFTDGSYEPSSEPPAAIGAVLVSPHGHVVEFFGEYIPASLTAILLRESEHPIYELEILPLIIVAAVWKRFLAGAMVVFYVDNDAAKSAFIQGTSPTNAGRTLLDQFTALEAALRIYPWFGRVPSASNPADPPSRMLFDLPFLKSGLRIRISFPAHLEEMGLATGEPGSMIP